MAYYTQGLSIAEISRQLMRDESTVRRWLGGRCKIPYWVPELLRLRHELATVRAYEMAGSVLREQLEQRLKRSDVVTSRKDLEVTAPLPTPKAAWVPVALDVGRPEAAAPAFVVDE